MDCHWHSVLITGHDMKHVMVELYTLPSDPLFTKYQGFWVLGWELLPIFLPMKCFWVTISRVLLLFFSNKKKLFTRSHFAGYDI
ncbi:hypothetical protein N8882_01155 [Methylophilaceae bacterium]|nr:hypothetical protein [Methylophilaceae bacterium]